MTPADKRMTELLDKWLTSLELHLKYADLPDADYFAVQPWPGRRPRNCAPIRYQGRPWATESSPIPLN